MPDPTQTGETAPHAGAVIGSAPASSPSFYDLALRFGNYAVDDLHIKGPVLLGVIVMGYGFFHPDLMQACKDYAFYIGTVLGGVAVGAAAKKS